MLGNWVFPSEYYLSLLKLIGIVLVIAVFSAVLFFLIKEFHYAYSDGKRKGENRYWIYYVKDVIKDFKELCWNCDWIKQIIVTIKKTSAPSNQRPNDSFGGVIFNEGEKFSNQKSENPSNLSHVNRILKRLSTKCKQNRKEGIVLFWLAIIHLCLFWLELITSENLPYQTLTA